MERPILFSAPMVRALLDGRKTQTRRVLKLPASLAGADLASAYPDDALWGAFGNGGMKVMLGEEMRRLRCPYGQPVDTLWVREAWAHCVLSRDNCDEYHSVSVEVGKGTHVAFAADPRVEISGRWRPSIHMPRWASRLTLRIVSVRAERLQDITEGDAIEEGCSSTPLALRVSADEMETACEQFRRLWDEINGHRAPWASNPWVWRVNFEVVRG